MELIDEFKELAERTAAQKERREQARRFLVAASEVLEGPQPDGVLQGACHVVAALLCEDEP